MKSTLKSRHVYFITIDEEIVENVNEINLQLIFNLNHRLEHMLHLLCKTRHDYIFVSWKMKYSIIHFRHTSDYVYCCG